MKKIKFALFLVLSALTPLITAQTGLQKLNEYNQQQAVFYLENLSFFVAFVGGIISILLPCTLAILPAFFAYTFKERKNITKMTLVFFVGFSLVFVALGIFAAAIGQTIASIQIAETKSLVFIAGIFLILFGIMMAFGKGFTFMRIQNKTGNDVFGVFLFGVFFALGWSACLGPVLASILLIALTFHNYIYSGILLFFYSLGLFVPLFFISIIFDKYNLTQNKWLKGKEFGIRLFHKTFSIHTTNLIAGTLLIGSGIVFIIYNGTNVINTLDPLRTSIYAYTLEGKLFSLTYIKLISIITFLSFLSIVGYFLYKTHKNQNQ